MEIHVGQHNSVLEEHRRVGSGARDFAELYPAAETADLQLPVQVVKSFQFDGRPLLWFNADKSGVVCDQNAFPHGLTVVDATKMRCGDRKTVGAVSAVAFEALGVRDLANFLIHAGVIQTWIHIEARLQLMEISPILVSLEGMHTYFTNEEQTERLTIEIEVEPKSNYSCRIFVRIPEFNPR
ncbi:MAG: hypothetical protein AAF585_08255 [Verrucomicrobiota bacterium]